MKRLLLLALLALPLMADEQQPFDPISVGLHVAYLNGRVAPEGDVAIKMGKPVMGFQPFEVSGFAVLALKGSPVRLGASAVTGVAMMRQLGEYVDVGPLTQFGIGSDGRTTGMVGKFGGVADYRFGHSQHWSAELVLVVSRNPIGAANSPVGNFTPEGALGVRYGFHAAAFNLPAAPKFKKAKKIKS